MKVRALTSFGGGGVHHGMGDVFELPEGVDWLRAGLVEVVKEEPESTAVKPAETATKKPAARKRTTRKK